MNGLTRNTTTSSGFTIVSSLSPRRYGIVINAAFHVASTVNHSTRILGDHGKQETVSIHEQNL